MLLHLELLQLEQEHPHLALDRLYRTASVRPSSQSEESEQTRLLNSLLYTLAGGIYKKLFLQVSEEEKSMLRGIARSLVKCFEPANRDYLKHAFYKILSSSQ